MKRKLIVVLAVAALALLATGCQKLKARDQLNKGVQAFKNAQYAEAVEHFKTAVELDPDVPDGPPVPGHGLHEPVHSGRGVARERADGAGRPRPVQKVLEQDPKNTVAIASIASLYLEPEEVGRGQAVVREADRGGSEQQGSLLQPRLHRLEPSGIPMYGAARAKLGMKPEDPGPIKDKKVKEELKAKYLPVIDEGLENLEKALQIDPEYDDAMAYVNLLHPRARRPGGHPGGVQEGDRGRRRLGPEGPGRPRRPRPSASRPAAASSPSRSSCK